MPTIECGTACTVTVQLTPAPPTEENIADIAAAAGILAVLLVTVWGLKQLLNIFRTDSE